MTTAKQDPEMQAADQLDQAIDRLQYHGDTPGLDRQTAHLLQGLTAVYQASVPEGLEQRVAANFPRGRARLEGWAPLRIVAGGLGVVWTAQALTLFFAGDWLANFLGFGYDPHIYKEQAFAYGAVAVAMLIGAARPERLAGSVTVGVPLGAMVGLFGLVEIPHSQNPAAELLHVVTAALAGLLYLLWRRQNPRREQP